ncbi:MAG: hypothetical protein WC506_05585 [Candidatus Micrarchaeia archaeon]
MGCMCKKILKILAGLALIAGAFNVGFALTLTSAWLVIGLYLLLAGLMPFICKCECCCGGSCCDMGEMKGKKKK